MAAIICQHKHKADCNTTEYNMVRYVEQNREAQKCSYLSTKPYIHRKAQPEPALVSAGPWQGLDATASAKRKPIRGSGAEPGAGFQGAQPPVEGQGALQSRS